MSKINELIETYSTDRPHTFYLEFKWSKYYSKPTNNYTAGRQVYKKEAEKIIKRLENQGLRPMLKEKYKYNPQYYITFRSKHDAAAFKLGWL